jgi:hypothetical protein
MEVDVDGDAYRSLQCFQTPSNSTVGSQEQHHGTILQVASNRTAVCPRSDSFHISSSQICSSPTGLDENNMDCQQFDFDSSMSSPNKMHSTLSLRSALLAAVVRGQNAQKENMFDGCHEKDRYYQSSTCSSTYKTLDWATAPRLPSSPELSYGNSASSHMFIPPLVFSPVGILKGNVVTVPLRVQRHNGVHNRNQSHGENVDGIHDSLYESMNNIVYHSGIPTTGACNLPTIPTMDTPEVAARSTLPCSSLKMRRVAGPPPCLDMF